MIQFVNGDLLDQDVEVIVNSWNMNFIPLWLLLPQGVSGTIKKRGGVNPFRQLRNKGILMPGDAVITGAGLLKYKAIIHVASLNCFWISNQAIIRNCTKNALDIAINNGYCSIAFPLLGACTGGIDPMISKRLLFDEISRSSYEGLVLIVLHS